MGVPMGKPRNGREWHGRNCIIELFPKLE